MSDAQDALPLPDARPPVTLDNGNPAAVLGACKRAAIRANWSLRAWVEFSDTARACLSPDALPEEFALFMRVVEQRFAVTRTTRFNPDPTSWAPH